MTRFAPLLLMVVIPFLALHKEVSAACTLTTPDSQDGITDSAQFQTSWSGCVTPVQIQFWDQTDNKVLTTYNGNANIVDFTVTNGVGVTVYFVLTDTSGASFTSTTYVVKPNTALSIASSQSTASLGSSSTSPLSLTPTTTTSKGSPSSTTTSSSSTSSPTQSPSHGSSVPVAAIAGAAAGGGIVLTALLIFLYLWNNKRRQRKLEDDILRRPVRTSMVQAYDSDFGPHPQRLLHTRSRSGPHDTGYPRDTIISNSTTGGHPTSPMTPPDGLRSGRPRAMSAESQPASSESPTGDGFGLGPQQVLQLHPSSQPAEVSSSGHPHSSAEASKGTGGENALGQGGAGNVNRRHSVTVNVPRAGRNDLGDGADVGGGQQGGGYSGLPEV